MTKLIDNDHNWAVGMYEAQVAVCATKEGAMREAEARVTIAKRNRSALVWENDDLIEKLGIARVSRFPHARVFPTRDPVTSKPPPTPPNKEQVRADAIKQAYLKRSSKQTDARDRARAAWEALTKDGG